jgi:hypothetical protein
LIGAIRPALIVAPISAAAAASAAYSFALSAW